MDLKEKAITVHKRLLKEYGEPTWRNPLPPLDELISTILSQNTNDTNRDRAFNSLKEHFPTWENVRDAEEDEIIDAIRTAGLANQKGPRIKKILEQIEEERGSLNIDFLGNMPTDAAREWLLQFKGVGEKTAAIVLLFSLDKPAFPVDTHIYRVTGRLGIRPEKMNPDAAHHHLASLLPSETYYSAHLNIIRLGRDICTARNPDCPSCPLRDICDYYLEDYKQ